MSSEKLIPTTVIGSYPQPGFLVDRRRLVGAGVPRVRDKRVWEVEPDHLDEAIEAATLVAIADQQAAGVDIITDGEVGRESYFNHFANALAGVDPDNIGVGINRNGTESKIPLIVGPISRTEPVELQSATFLRQHATAQTKVTVPGPFTLSQLADNQHYPDQRTLALAYAKAVNAELKDLAAAGIDMLQVDEPYLQANAESARQFAVDVITAALDGITTPTTLHTCYGYAVYVKDKQGGYPFFAELADIPVDYIAIETAQPQLDLSIIAKLAPRGVVIGVLDMGREDVESPNEIADRIRQAVQVIEPEKLSVSPDCGMKFMPRARARAKLEAMVEGAAIVRHELTGE